MTRSHMISFYIWMQFASLFTRVKICNQSKHQQYKNSEWWYLHSMKYDGAIRLRLSKFCNAIGKILNSSYFVFFNWENIALVFGFCRTTTQINHNYTCITSLLSLSPRPIPLGHHKAPGWAPCKLVLNRRVKIIRFDFSQNLTSTQMRVCVCMCLTCTWIKGEVGETERGKNTLKMVIIWYALLWFYFFMFLIFQIF